MTHATGRLVTPAARSAAGSPAIAASGTRTRTRRATAGASDGAASFGTALAARAEARATAGVSRSGAAAAAGAPYASLIAAAAREHGLDPTLLTEVIRAESGFDPKAVSPAGAKGLMQLMDGTAAGLGVRDPFDPAQSIRGGSKYLAQLLRRYGGDTRLALAAYNAGPGAVDRHGGVPPYQETQRYVAKIANAAGQSAAQATRQESSAVVRPAGPIDIHAGGLGRNPWGPGWSPWPSGKAPAGMDPWAPGWRWTPPDASGSASGGTERRG
jgi:soluble lytic murein transglycosylase-like protein